MGMRTCCFCFDLKQGTLAVGIFTITTKLLGILVFAILLGLAHRKEDDTSYEDIIYGSTIGENALSVSFAALLIVGVQKSIRGLFIPWMVLAVIEMGSLVYWFFGSIVLITQGEPMIGEAIGSLIGIPLLIYMFWCVCTYYRSFSTQNASYQEFTNESTQNEVPKLETNCSNVV